MNTVIFDMDGLLLDTEPLWGESMMAVANEYEIGVTLEQFRFTTGLRIDEVTKFWKEKFTWPTSFSSEQVAEHILDDIIERAKLKGKIMPGVVTCLEWMKNKGIRLGVATSSPARMMKALLEYFQISNYFDALCSADTLQFGKPHPAVYLQCAELLKAQPYNCVAIEDSVNGMIAAKAARMKVIVVPEAEKLNDKRFSLADMKLSSLEDLDEAAWQIIREDNP